MQRQAHLSKRKTTAGALLFPVDSGLFLLYLYCLMNR